MYTIMTSSNTIYYIIAINIRTSTIVHPYHLSVNPGSRKTVLCPMVETWIIQKLFLCLVLRLLLYDVYCIHAYEYLYIYVILYISMTTTHDLWLPPKKLSWCSCAASKLRPLDKEWLDNKCCPRLRLNGMCRVHSSNHTHPRAAAGNGILTQSKGLELSSLTIRVRNELHCTHKYLLLASLCWLVHRNVHQSFAVQPSHQKFDCWLLKKYSDSSSVTPRIVDVHRSNVQWSIACLKGH